ncbi:MAG: hypothetical protein HC846_02870 [Blastocatellia bacterium]|nr:hypothetical protein [Blastocatellia bacterium]
MVDIQRSQIDGVKELTAQMTSEELRPVPTVRTRIALVDGVAPDYQQKEVRQQQGQIGREFAVTYRPNLEENETVIAGKWWDSAPTAETEVSVVDDMARLLKVGIGSVMTFDVLGRKINAKVTSCSQN